MMGSAIAGEEPAVIKRGNCKFGDLYCNIDVETQAAASVRVPRFVGSALGADISPEGIRLSSGDGEIFMDWTAWWWFVLQVDEQATSKGVKRVLSQETVVQVGKRFLVRCSPRCRCPHCCMAGDLSNQEQ
jgi:hypothetical protein